MGYWVYMLRCCDGSLYTGFAVDPERRLTAHQRGQGAKYTRSRLPVELVYQEELPDKSTALRREAAIKKFSREEKLQLILVMSRDAQLYLLDEPIAGVDPAARDFILETILRNYNEQGTVLISTHLISDVEKVLDEVVFLCNGTVVRQDTVDHIRETEGMTVDGLFRDIFRAMPYRREPAVTEFPRMEGGEQQ